MDGLDAVHHVPEHDEGAEAAVREPQVAAHVARTLRPVQPLTQRPTAELHLDHQRQLFRILSVLVRNERFAVVREGKADLRVTLLFLRSEVRR